MAQVEVTPKVVRPGSTITVHVSGYDGRMGVGNVQADCVSVEPARDRFSFGVGAQIEVSHEFAVTLRIPDGVRAGPHFLARLTCKSMNFT